MTSTICADVRNPWRVPFRLMRQEVQAMLVAEAQRVEWWSRDASAWLPAPVPPRQWRDEAYRIPPAAGDTGLHARAASAAYPAAGAGDWEVCDKCGRDYPPGAVDRWHLVDGEQLCARCAWVTP